MPQQRSPAFGQCALCPHFPCQFVRVSGRHRADASALHPGTSGSVPVPGTLGLGGVVGIGMGQEALSQVDSPRLCPVVCGLPVDGILTLRGPRRSPQIGSSFHLYKPQPTVVQPSAFAPPSNLVVRAAPQGLEFAQNSALHGLVQKGAVALPLPFSLAGVGAGLGAAFSGAAERSVPGTEAPPESRNNEIQQDRR